MFESRYGLSARTPGIKMIRGTVGSITTVNEGAYGPLVSVLDLHDNPSFSS